MSAKRQHIPARWVKSVTLFLIANYLMMTGTFGQNISQALQQGQIQAIAACPTPAQFTPLHLAGDVDEGEFTLEESDNGQTISATWSGTVIDNSCGKEIRGTWIKSLSTTATNAALGQASNHRFVLRKLPGWQ